MKLISQPSRNITLNCDGCRVRQIGYIPKSELLAVSFERENSVYIYKTDGMEDCSRVFCYHKSTIVAFVHLFDNLQASIDAKGTIITWDASNGIVLDTLDVLYKRPHNIRMQKLSSTDLEIGVNGGRIQIV